MKETETRPRFVVLLAIIVAFLVVLAGLNVARLWRIRTAPGHHAKQVRDE